MRNIIVLMVFIMLPAFNLAAQTNIYEQRYDLLVDKVGPSGVGVETVLDNWEKVDSTSMKVLMARFSFWFSKASSTRIVKESVKKYLGMDPMLTLKDSTGTPVYYYQETDYDDELYGKAMRSLDKAISLYPDVLDLRFAKANAYIAYEKGSPDMAVAYLQDLIRLNDSGRYEWEYEGRKPETDFFKNAVQEYCYTFYQLATPSSYNAFLTLSENMLEIHPNDPGFMNNIGAYLLVVKADPKAALKQYSKVLKKYPEDYTAIRNAYLAAHRMKDARQEKKYLQMLSIHGNESDRRLAEARLGAIEEK